MIEQVVIQTPGHPVSSSLSESLGRMDGWNDFLYFWRWLARMAGWLTVRRVTFDTARSREVGPLRKKSKAVETKVGSRLSTALTVARLLYLKLLKPCAPQWVQVFRVSVKREVYSVDWQPWLGAKRKEGKSLRKEGRKREVGYSLSWKLIELFVCRNVELWLLFHFQRP